MDIRFIRCLGIPNERFIGEIDMNAIVEQGLPQGLNLLSLADRVS